MVTESHSHSGLAKRGGNMHRSQGGGHGHSNQQLRQLFNNSRNRRSQGGSSFVRPPAPAVSLDCEMVGCGPDGNISALAQVSICDEKGDVLLDEFVMPDMRITDFRHHVTGLSWSIIRDRGISFNAARTLVTDIIRGKVLVGHALQHDLQVLALDHPVHMIRDTSKYKPLRPPGLARNAVPSLRRLTSHWLNREIQTGIHNSVEDCRAAMDLYRKFQSQWERQFLAVNDAQNSLNSIEYLDNKLAHESGMPQTANTPGQAPRKRARSDHGVARQRGSEMYDSDDNGISEAATAVASESSRPSSNVSAEGRKRQRSVEKGAPDGVSGYDPTKDAEEFPGIDLSRLTKKERKKLRRKLRVERGG
ncbi:UNVERIFIED_CONTAM: suppressor of mitotic defects protein [Hammondia hammondi]|eukprot:XP_008886991.1 suppressor of mitotic defects protein [Hammondia hammondi]